MKGVSLNFGCALHRTVSLLDRDVVSFAGVLAVPARSSLWIQVDRSQGLDLLVINLKVLELRHRTKITLVAFPNALSVSLRA